MVKIKTKKDHQKLKIHFLIVCGVLAVIVIAVACVLLLLGALDLLNVLIII